MRLDKFRLTSPDRDLLDQAAHLYGGTVQPWKDQPGQYELFIEAEELPCMVAPKEVSQWYELWSGGGCQRRCDGVCETISDQPCLCDPDNRECKTTTRLSVYLHQLAGVGTFRLESHGWYAATELPEAARLLIQLAANGRYVPAALAIEQRTVKRDGQTKKFPVPVLRVKQALQTLMTGEIIDTPALPDARPALPPGEPQERMQETVRKNERSTYAGATGARPQPPKETRPAAPPPGQTVLEPEVVDDDTQARAHFAALFTDQARQLGWEKKTQVAFLRETLQQPDLKSMDAITAPQWETITNLTGQAIFDREASLELWGQCCALWESDENDTLARDQWFAECLNLTPQPLSVYTPAMWAGVKQNLLAAKQAAESGDDDGTGQGDLFGDE
jgi:hypothetical protein